MTIRVLLVDDVVEVRRLLRTALRLRGGFDVVGEAGGGAEAVRLAESLHPEVVVLDLGLPDIAGREVLTRIRDRSPASKVVVFSGAVDEDRSWIAGHADGYVLKDVELAQLLDLLESVGRRQATEVEVHLPQALSTAAEARRFVKHAVTQWNLTPILDDALLVVSELATNAVTHAGSSCRIRLSLTDTSLRIDVTDAGEGTPEPQPSSSTAEHGRGLHLINALATAWGLEEVPGQGKVVWAELSRPR
ncbi:response regulator [Nocardioides sp. MAHUQ-72]|uniref:response regulator n=1 Tax=unclassified Nocardioides TaxID=2615069 RepID=UPI0036245DF7